MRGDIAIPPKSKANFSIQEQKLTEFEGKEEKDSDQETRSLTKSRYTQRLSLDGVEKSETLIKIEDIKFEPFDRGTTVQK